MSKSPKFPPTKKRLRGKNKQNQQFSLTVLDFTLASALPEIKGGLQLLQFAKAVQLWWSFPTGHFASFQVIDFWWWWITILIKASLCMNEHQRFSSFKDAKWGQKKTKKTGQYPNKIAKILTDIFYTPFVCVWREIDTFNFFPIIEQIKDIRKSERAWINNILPRTMS